MPWGSRRFCPACQSRALLELSRTSTTTGDRVTSWSASTSARLGGRPAGVIFQCRACGETGWCSADEWGDNETAPP